MENERLERIKEIYRHEFCHVTKDTEPDTAVLLMAIRGLGEMIIEFAEMIEGQKQDLDNLINQEVKIPEFTKE